MKWHFKKWILACIAILLTAATGSSQTFASSPYQGYTWNSLGHDVHSVNGYLYADSIEGAMLETGEFKNPESIFLAPDDTIYVVDTGNSRIVHLDQRHDVLHVYGVEEGPGKLNEPKGVFVKEDGTLYVADTKNQRIVLFNREGKFLKELKAPESPLLGVNFSYSPSKLVLDKRDYMFVVSDGNTQGLMQIDPNGDFKGFYGANHIGFSWKRLMIKLVATKEQKSQLATVNPAEFASVDIDTEGFMYTTTLGDETNQVKRLSPVGVDTLNSGGKRIYGDYFSYGPFSVASFIGISVNKTGLITALDLQTGKIFQYDKLGNFLFAFGGIGEQDGLFVTPSGLDESSDGTIYVVDRGRNRIDLFRPTPFGDLVHEASNLYVDGRYEQAEVLWQEVLKKSSNFDMAYLAIGKALYKAERYKEAMGYYKLARAKFDYSEAFREYRKEFVREHFNIIAVGAILLVILLRWGLPVIIRFLKPWARKIGKRALVSKRGNSDGYDIHDAPGA